MPHAAGSDLDKLVAERVLGWQWVTNPQGHSGWASNGPDAPLVVHGETWGGFWAYPLTPAFSTERDAALAVVDALHRRGWGVRVVTWPDVTQASVIEARGPEAYVVTASAVGATLAHAVCMAALAAFGEGA